MSYVLGIDIGTSKVAIAVIDANSGAPVTTAQRQFSSTLKTIPGHSEQSASHMLSDTFATIRNLDPCTRKKISAIGITGQMHGVMMWSSRSPDKASELVTWQDGRCSPDFLSGLEGRIGEHGLRTGFGCATLAWYAQHERSRLSHYDRASTIHDYVAARLCGTGEARTDPTNAASWGLYDLKTDRWKGYALSGLAIPASLMPTVVATGSRAGVLAAEPAALTGLPEGIPICTPIGDNQASLLATLTSPQTQVAVTLGTGGQVAVAIPREMLGAVELPVSAEIRPYVDDMVAVVGASLCGGSAWLWFPSMIRQLCTDLGMTPPSLDVIFGRIDESAATSAATSLNIHPSFLGERHDPARRATISGLTPDNFTLAQVGMALARGIAANLYEMIPSALVRARTTLVGSGNTIRRSKTIQKALVDVFQLPIELLDVEEEAAQGAALLARRMMA